MTAHKLLLAALAVAVAGVVGACDSGSSALSRMVGTDMASLISIETAIETARAEVPDGVPVGVELELDDDDDEGEPPTFEVLMFRDSAAQLVEVEIHAVTGAVLEVEVEDDDDDFDD